MSYPVTTFTSLSTMSRPAMSTKLQAALSTAKAAILSLLFIALLTGCETGSFNKTAYPFQINTEKLEATSIENVIVANVNFGGPSKTYLHQNENKIDGVVKDRLKQGGYVVQDNALFKKAWREAVRKYGEPYSPVTSQINAMAFRRVMYTVLTTLKEESDIDAVVFTDLIEREIAFGAGQNRAAKWDGVTRKPKVKGGATGISQGFDWSQTVPAVSISVTIYHVDAEQLFQSIGGIEVTRQLDPNKGGNGRFVRRDKIFSSRNNIREGVSLALHPFVKMKNYRGN